MRDFARHKELKRVLGAGIVTEIDQPLIHNLRPGFGCDIAAQVDVEFAGDLEIVCRPGIALRVEEIDAAAARDGDKRIGLRFFAIEFRWLEMKAGKGSRPLRGG